MQTIQESLAQQRRFLHIAQSYTNPEFKVEFWQGRINPQGFMTAGLTTPDKKHIFSLPPLEPYGLEVYLHEQAHATLAHDLNYTPKHIAEYEAENVAWALLDLEHVTMPPELWVNTQRYVTTAWESDKRPEVSSAYQKFLVSPYPVWDREILARFFLNLVETKFKNFSPNGLPFHEHPTSPGLER